MQLGSLVRNRHSGSENVCVCEREIQYKDQKLRVLSSEQGQVFFFLNLGTVTDITQPQVWESFFFHWQVLLASCPLFQVDPSCPQGLLPASSSALDAAAAVSLPLFLASFFPLSAGQPD